MRRRTVLATGAAVLSGVSAGCLETVRRDDAWRELVVDPPDGIYVPPHADEMVPYGTVTAGGREISVSATRPHSFWILAGGERSRAAVRAHHDAHLMVSVRDAETGSFVPAPVTVRIRSREGDPVDERSLWPMLSQRMGPHYGDNVSLADDGSYATTIRVGASLANVTGEVAGGLERPVRVGLAVEFDTGEIDALERRLIDRDESRGRADALEPMDRAIVDRRDFPSESVKRVTQGQVGDIDYAATVVEGGCDGRRETNETDVRAPILALTARTPYNSYPLPFASVSAAAHRDGEEIASAALRETIDGRLGHCYSSPIDPSILDGDELTIDLETPPQVARHEGYETAFLEPKTVTTSLD